MYRVALMLIAGFSLCVCGLLLYSIDRHDRSPDLTVPLLLSFITTVMLTGTLAHVLSKFGNRLQRLEEKLEDLEQREDY